MTFKIAEGLPIKYALGLHPAVPGYPTHQDFMFDVSSHIARVVDVKGKDWDVDDIKFSTKTLKYVFGESMNSPEFRDKIKALLADLLAQDRLTKKGEFIFIPEYEFSKYYLTA
jgi:hypothetical protein